MKFQTENDISMVCRCNSRSVSPIFRFSLVMRGTRTGWGRGTLPSGHTVPIYKIQVQTVAHEKQPMMHVSCVHIWLIISKRREGKQGKSIKRLTALFHQGAELALDEPLAWGCCKWLVAYLNRAEGTDWNIELSQKRKKKTKKKTHPATL